VYAQNSVTVAPGTLLVAFSDGLTESENVFGEQFGVARLKEEVFRQRDMAALDLGEKLVSVAEQWSGTSEQADDMTVVIARMG
jgi:sigma-B regulation protein RsbU (phosphoserine phosphatase)